MSTEPGAEAVNYTYRPSLVGAPWQFTLTGDDIEWRAGRQSGRAALRDVRLVRMTFRPANMQSYRFMTEVHVSGGPRLKIVSTSWKSMFEQERLDRQYTSFIAELHRRLAEAEIKPLLLRGSSPPLYWAGAVVFGAVGLALIVLMLRALQAGALGGAAFVAVFVGFFGWYGVNALRRNAPGIYGAGALPPLLMPKPQRQTSAF